MGQVRRCISRRPGLVTSAASASTPKIVLPFAEPPYIGCSNLNRGVFGCELTPALIAPRAGYTLDTPNGTVSAQCFPERSSPLTYGACVCQYTSTDGNSQMSAFCEASAELAPELLPFDVYLETAYEDTGLMLDYAEDEVEFGGETVTVMLAAPIEYLEYKQEGDIEDDAEYVYVG